MGPTSGTAPTDIPIEQPTIIDFAINLKTAKALGIAVPPPLLARAHAEAIATRPPSAPMALRVRSEVFSSQFSCLVSISRSCVAALLQ